MKKASPAAPYLAKCANCMCDIQDAAALRCPACKSSRLVVILGEQLHSALPEPTFVQRAKKKKPKPAKPKVLHIVPERPAVAPKASIPGGSSARELQESALRAAALAGDSRVYARADGRMEAPFSVAVEVINRYLSGGYPRC